MDEPQGIQEPQFSDRQWKEIRRIQEEGNRKRIAHLRQADAAAIRDTEAMIARLDFIAGMQATLVLDNMRMWVDTMDQKDLWVQRLEALKCRKG